MSAPHFSVPTAKVRKFVEGTWNSLDLPTGASRARSSAQLSMHLELNWRKW